MKTTSKELSINVQTETKLAGMLAKGKLKKDALEEFGDEELEAVGQYFTDKLNELKGVEFDRFYKKIEAVTPEDTKHQLWHSRHNTITWAISDYIQDNGRMPSPFELAKKTGISVTSMEEHLKEYSKDEKYLNSLGQFEFLKPKLLAKVFKFAVNGDMKAAKLYFEVVNKLNGESSTNPVINTQNNYIQINQFKLSQETIQKLEPEQLAQVENLLQQLVSKDVVNSKPNIP